MTSRKREPVVLSAARINRLLRPLRSRCISLAKYSSSQVCTTARLSRGESSKYSGQLIPATLSILPQPGSLGLRQYLDSDQAEMARRTYAVRDCFQDIVINTRRHAAEENYCRIKSLAALCSIVIGDNMENQIVYDDDDEEGMEKEDENDCSKLVDDLYDAIPTEYRRCALLSHALRLVLSHCSDNVTLLTRLLDVALNHKLDFEASLLLHSLITLTLGSPSSSKKPLICHPAHAGFLLDLYSQWSSNHTSNATFFRVFITALETSQDDRVWSSKAVHNIAQVMHVQDFTSYLRLISISSTFATETWSASVAFDPEARKSLLSRIYCWLKAILEQAPPAFIECDPCRSATTYSESIEVGEMLSCVLSLICRPKTLQVPDGLEADIQGIILSLSTYWLTIQRLPPQNLVEQLSVTLPCVSAFTPLVAKVFVDADGCLRAFRTTIHDMASRISTSNLLHLHASLLGCTLRFIEHPSHERELAIKNSVSETQNYRYELIELTYEAEDRFVRLREGSVVSQSVSKPSNAIATPLRRELFKDISEWEPRSGWGAPRSEHGRSAKKRKVTHGRHSIVSECASRNIALAPNSEHGHINVQISSANDRNPLFSTLLSRAAEKKAILHPNQPLPCIPSSPDVAEKAYQKSEPSMIKDDYQPGPFSDDALDLFAWTSSSPVK